MKNNSLSLNDYKYHVKKPFFDKTDSKNELECSFNLPWCLTEEYKERHTLSNHDLLNEIYTKTPTKYLWLAGLQYDNVEIPCSATHFVGMHKNKCTFRNSSYISTKLKNILLQERPTSTQTQNKLICPFDSFQPNLPVHFVNLEQLQNFPNLTNKANLVYESLWRFKDINVLPTYYYNGYILCARVFPKYIYEKVYGQALSALSVPNEYCVQGQIYCETDERFLITTRELHNEIVKFAQQSKEYFLKYYKDDLFTAEKHATNQANLGMFKNKEKSKQSKATEKKPTVSEKKSNLTEKKTNGDKTKSEAKKDNEQQQTNEQKQKYNVENKNNIKPKQINVEKKQIDQEMVIEEMAIEEMVIEETIPVRSGRRVRSQTKDEQIDTVHIQTPPLVAKKRRKV